MMRIKLVLFLSILCGSLFSSVAQENGLEAWFQKTDQFLKKYVDDGLIRYRAISENPSELMQLTHAIENVDLSKKDVATRKAFWINAYNLTVIDAVMTNYPVSSPLDIDGFFAEEKHKMAGEWVTLDEIEKKKLVDELNEERVHFVLVCAAKGCPPIMKGAYMPEKIDQQLEEQTRAALNNPDFIRVDHNKEKVALSKIFQWYKKDFTQEANSLRDYVSSYRNESPLPSNYRITYYEYDWSLNAKKK
ncbi:MAG: DUF547 domain-containing protein [Bacteroidetes bacterium SW_11_45_7]|nr:MAG: DUF547 domain-containing protein [Bacteroidetes bacterium SW_11_45_7]